ncbi:MAG: hypothetical protein FWE98_02395 [Oscillospiraceae bacterium]|nr:hypothetical protein [Oscillospiraceae bacterium]
MALLDARCTSCGAALKVNGALDAANCEFCGAAFIVEKAVQNYQVSIQAQNVFMQPPQAGASVLVQPPQALQPMGTQPPPVAPSKPSSKTGRAIASVAFGICSIIIAAAFYNSGAPGVIGIIPAILAVIGLVFAVKASSKKSIPGLVISLIGFLVSVIALVESWRAFIN